MDDKKTARAFAGMVGAMAANDTIVHLAAMLAKKGALGLNELEVLRHLQLRPFDEALAATKNQAALQIVHDDRERLDRVWQAAIQNL